MQFFEDLWNSIYNYLVNNFRTLILFVLVLVGGFIAMKIAMKLCRKAVDRSKLKGTAGNFLLSLIRIAIVVLYVIILLSMLGVDTTSLVAIFSVLTLAISLAVQGVISNLASGIMLVVTKPFEEGNYVDIDGTAGTVEKIHITCTKLKTPDNKVITIPNSTITSANIINYSVKDTRRVEFIFSAAYGSNIEKVKSVILGVISNHDLVLADPAPMVRLKTHGDSSLDFVARVWVKSGDYWTVTFDLNEQVLDAMENAGIEIPFPQMDVHVIQK